MLLTLSLKLILGRVTGHFELSAFTFQLTHAFTFNLFNAFNSHHKLFCFCFELSAFTFQLQHAFTFQLIYQALLSVDERAEQLFQDAGSLVEGTAGGHQVEQEVFQFQFHHFRPGQGGDGVVGGGGDDC